MYIHRIHEILARARRGYQIFWDSDRHCELLCGYLDLNPSPQEDHPLLLTAEQSLHPSPMPF